MPGKQCKHDKGSIEVSCTCTRVEIYIQNTLIYVFRKDGQFKTLCLNVSSPATHEIKMSILTICRVQFILFGIPLNAVRRHNFNERTIVFYLYAYSLFLPSVKFQCSNLGFLCGRRIHDSIFSLFLRSTSAKKIRSKWTRSDSDEILLSDMQQ